MNKNTEYPIDIQDLKNADTIEGALKLSEEGYLLLNTLVRTYREAGRPDTQYAVYVMGKPA